MVRLVDKTGGEAVYPDPWSWEGDILTSEDEVLRFVQRLKARLWRAAGKSEFEP